MTNLQQLKDASDRAYQDMCDRLSNGGRRPAPTLPQEIVSTLSSGYMSILLPAIAAVNDAKERGDQPGIEHAVNQLRQSAAGLTAPHATGGMTQDSVDRSQAWVAAFCDAALS